MLQPGVNAAAKRTITLKKGVHYTFDVKGAVESVVGAEDCIHDLFYDQCNGGAPFPQRQGIRTASQGHYPGTPLALRQGGRSRMLDE